MCRLFKTLRGDYVGMEAVLETEQVAVMLACGLKARLLLCVIEDDKKFALSGMSTEGNNQISLKDMDESLERGGFNSSTVRKQLRAASEFLHSGGEQVLITTLRQLPDALKGDGGLRIGIPGNILDCS